MLDVKLDPELEAAATRQARREKKSKAAVVRRALEAYLEEAEDARDVMKRRHERSIPLKEVGKRLGLDR